MQKAFKYRLYPNKQQTSLLFSIFDTCRNLYNSALQERISYYRKYHETISYTTQAAYLHEIRKNICTAEFKLIYSQTLQEVLLRLNISYENFFRRVKQKKEGLGIKAGFPRYKSKRSFKSICFPKVNSTLSKNPIALQNNKLKVYGIPDYIKIKYHRPYEGTPKQCRIIKKGHLFYLVITCDNVSKKVLPKTNKEVGIDLGLINFITLDDGTTYKHPKPYKTAKEKLAYRQRKLALKQKGSKNRKRQARLVAKIHSKIADIRHDFQHKLANKLIKEYDKIVVEKLDIENMLQSKGLEVSKSNIQDASWGEFVQKLIYKAESADKLVVQVEPKNTSKTCSSCGNIKKDLTLRDRIYSCSKCRLKIDRDINAAKNIKALGTSAVIILPKPKKPRFKPIIKKVKVV